MDNLAKIEELAEELGVDIHRTMTHRQTRRLITAGIHRGIPIYELRRYLDWNENIQVPRRRTRV